jgi:hypothetical protein
VGEQNNNANRWGIVKCNFKATDRYKAFRFDRCI